jgi:FAD/FMN-containing dehydrogenase
MYSIMPACVAFPRHAGDVAAAVTAAAEHGVPVTARGAGTSLAGQTTSPGLILDLSRHLNRIISLDPEARTAVVEPGVVQDQLNKAASEHGLMFGPDTSTSNRATLGGMIGNNSAGSGSIRYGMTIDHVRELDVVLSDGSAAHFGGPLTEADWEQHSAKSGLEGGIYRELAALTRASENAIAGRHRRDRGRPGL